MKRLLILAAAALATAACAGLQNLGSDDKPYENPFYAKYLNTGSSLDAAITRTVDRKPGHAQALFQLGLVEERNHHTDRAVQYYAKAFSINPALLRVDANPRILDSKLTHLALLTMYGPEHSRRSMLLQGPAIGTPATPPPAASPQPDPKDIVTPSPPATEVGAQAVPVPSPALSGNEPVPRSRRRGRARTTPAEDLPRP